MALLIRTWESDRAMHSVGDAPHGIVGLHYHPDEGFTFIVNPTREIPTELVDESRRAASQTTGVVVGSAIIPGGLDELGSQRLSIDDVVAACEGNDERLGVWMGACEAARLAADDLRAGLVRQLEHATEFVREVFDALNETAVD